MVSCNFSIAEKRIMTNATYERKHLTGDSLIVSEGEPMTVRSTSMREVGGRGGQRQRRRGREERGEDTTKLWLGELIHLLGLLKEVEITEMAASPKAHLSMGDGS